MLEEIVGVDWKIVFAHAVGGIRTHSIQNLGSGILRQLSLGQPWQPAAGTRSYNLQKTNNQATMTRQVSPRSVVRILRMF